MIIGSGGILTGSAGIGMGGDIGRVAAGIGSGRDGSLRSLRMGSTDSVGKYGSGAPASPSSRAPPTAALVLLST